MNSDTNNPFMRPSREVLAVETRAWETIRFCVEHSHSNGVPLPIPVERWIESPLGFELGVSDLSNLGPRVLGAAFIREGAVQIDTRLADNDARFRFTCAHELGHLVLHRDIGLAFQDTDSTVQLPENQESRVEWEADRFAAAFLMPSPFVLAELSRIADQRGVDRVRYIAALLDDSTESESLWRHRFLPRLTRRFDVSISAMLRRLEDIVLNDGKPLMSRSLRTRLLRATNRPSPSSRLSGAFPQCLPALFKDIE
jgi:hypothetical protein